MKEEFSKTYVGINVSKDRLAVADGAPDGEVLSLGTFANSPGSVDKLLKRLAERSARVSICYEAGPTGYGLYRQVRAFGFECVRHQMIWNTEA